MIDYETRMGFVSTQHSALATSFLLLSTDNERSATP